ncbi:MAG: hypothetical protein OXN92_04420 [Gammaproteobacteria bacterium]|nr:hypothetical protein [Gammaproteobacteria bacterium]
MIDNRRYLLPLIILSSMAVGFAAGGRMLDAAQSIPAPSSPSAVCIDALLQQRLELHNAHSSLLAAMVIVALGGSEEASDRLQDMANQAANAAPQRLAAVRRACGQ